MDFSRIFADLTPIALTLYRSKAFSADPWRIMPELSRNWAVDTLYNRKEKIIQKRLFFIQKGLTIRKIRIIIRMRKHKSRITILYGGIQNEGLRIAPGGQSQELLR